MLRLRDLIQGSLFAALAAYGYAQTNSIYLLLTAAWLAGFAAWNGFEGVLRTMSDGTGQFERYVATHHLSIPVLGLAVGTFSVVANSTIESHWFLLAHGIFWIILGLVLLMVMRFAESVVKVLLPANRETYFQKVILPSFETLGTPVRNRVKKRREMDITSIWRGHSVAFIEVMNGPIVWLNYKGNRDDENTMYIEFGVPTFKAGRALPKVRVRSKRIRQIPLVGKIVDVRWRGKDFGLAIIDRLNGDDSLREAMLDGFRLGYLKADLEIDAHPEHSCWILTEKTWSPALPKGLWDGFQFIADQLPARRVPLETAYPPGLRRLKSRTKRSRKFRGRRNQVSGGPYPMLSRASMEKVYRGPARLVVPIGVSEAKITNVTKAHVEFIDQDGVSHLIDLEHCRRNYDARFNRGVDRGYQSVGLRGPNDRPPWMSFADEPPTMLEFSSRDDLYRQVLDPLAELGWYTFGTDSTTKIRAENEYKF